MVRCQEEPDPKVPLYVWARRMAEQGHSAFGECQPCTEKEAGE